MSSFLNFETLSPPDRRMIMNVAIGKDILVDNVTSRAKKSVFLLTVIIIYLATNIVICNIEVIVRKQNDIFALWNCVR